MGKIGIICDKYKTQRFRNKLTSAGFTEFEVSDYKTLDAIAVTVKDENLMDSQKQIAKICKEVELHFSRAN